MSDDADGVALMMVQSFCPFCWAVFASQGPRTPSPDPTVVTCPGCQKRVTVRFWRRVDD